MSSNQAFGLSLPKPKIKPTYWERVGKELDNFDPPVAGALEDYGDGMGAGIGLIIDIVVTGPLYTAKSLIKSLFT